MTFWKNILLFLIFAGALFMAIYFGLDLAAGLQDNPSNVNKATLMTDVIALVVGSIIVLYIGFRPIKALMQ